jgi:diguanylate cyclase (GGDEF)-like protein
MAVWHFGPPRIPLTGLILSFAALAVPVLGTFWFPESSGDYELLLWLLALVPAFLLAYYRGWVGVALAMLVGMVVLSVVQVFVIVLAIETDWVLLLAVITAYIALGLSLGLVSELLHQERARAERLALLDDLTRIPNRRLADLFLEKEFAAAVRGRALTAVLFDIDRFKSYNDRYGHAAGDEALRHFVQILSRHTRGMDLCARYGGEEFLAVLSDARIEAGVAFAERVRASLLAGTGRAASPAEGGPEEGTQGSAATQRVPPFTVSAGVAQFTSGMETTADLIAVADRALYQAKADGRDRVSAHVQSAH